MGADQIMLCCQESLQEVAGEEGGDEGAIWEEEGTEILLEEAEDYSHSLFGNLEILENKVYDLHNEVRCARRAFWS